jgi:hypothetical protein
MNRPTSSCTRTLDRPPRAGKAHRWVLMKRSHIIQAAYFLIFLIGIVSLLDEELIQFGGAAKIDAKYVLPPLIVAISLWKRRLWGIEKWRFFRETFAIVALLCITAFLYIIIINRTLPPLGEFDVTGRIVQIKPGKGTTNHRLREMTVLLNNGERVNFSLMQRVYVRVSSGYSISFKAKIGGLGLLYL